MPASTALEDNIKSLLQKGATEHDIISRIKNWINTITDDQARELIKTVRAKIEEKKPTNTGAFATPDRKETVRLAKEILKETDFITIAETGEIKVKVDGVFQSCGEVVIDSQVRKLNENASSYVSKEVQAYIRSKTYMTQEKFESTRRLIKLNNVFFDFSLCEVGEPLEGEIVTLFVPVTYDPTKENPKVRKFLAEIMPDDVERQALIERLALTLDVNSTYQRGSIWDGGGRNGKSTLINFMVTFLGGKNCVNIELYDFFRDRFATSNIENKLANFTDDLSDTEIEHSAVIKKIITHNHLSVQSKGRNRKEIKPFVKIFAAENRLPEVRDESDAWYRRWDFFHFTQKFEGITDNPDILKEITSEDELSGTLNMFIDALKQIKERGFTQISTIATNREQWKSNIEPLMKWINDFVEVKESETMWGKTAYQTYCLWCKDVSIEPKSRRQFFEKLRVTFPKSGGEKIHRSSSEKDYKFLDLRLKTTETEQLTL